jgi:hypothetical protein
MTEPFDAVPLKQPETALRCLDVLPSYITIVKKESNYNRVVTQCVTYHRCCEVDYPELVLINVIHLTSKVGSVRTKD